MRAHGKVALVDDDLHDWLNGFRWYVDERGYPIAFVGHNKSALMHRMIHLFCGHLEVDHINRDKLDNRLENLRLVSHRENLLNCGPRITSQSGYRGVSRNRQGKWVARCRVNGKYLHLGVFATPKMAAAVYADAIKNPDRYARTTVARWKAQDIALVLRAKRGELKQLAKQLGRSHVSCIALRYKYSREHSR